MEEVILAPLECVQRGVIGSLLLFPFLPALRPSDLPFSPLPPSSFHCQNLVPPPPLLPLLSFLSPPTSKNDAAARREGEEEETRE